MPRGLAWVSAQSWSAQTELQTLQAWGLGRFSEC
jgi:hypothetical protein